MSHSYNPDQTNAPERSGKQKGVLQQTPILGRNRNLHNESFVDEKTTILIEKSIFCVNNITVYTTMKRIFIARCIEIPPKER